ncbi:putative transmembrane protein [Oceaniovalibus guishaninsula JLT2003]|uniref:Putative transmembrane protein n=1 Tax=Oceaniovalibus guishaninsula JLT2003 TaxID=1231392 RepID=K2HLH5_9RHOB|nr:AzlD domain-containing protein [Oceaniovalibus guishaninsula]EKE43739.1 putative transmembrane protein [Oceaniovalibus guishaninsula JLT2003]
MDLSAGEIWLVIGALGAGTFLIRFSFLGLIGRRAMPPLVLRLLRYTPVAVIPGIVAPLILSPAATDGQFDPARGLAALATLAVGIATRNVLAAIGAGAITLYAMLWMLG